MKKLEPTKIASLSEWLQNHLRIITMVGGSVLVALWTVVRHISNGMNFDVVGQVGVVDQWTRGLHDGTQLGATNYLLKMPVYYIVNHFGFLSPHLKLLFLALVFNITTFILLIVLFEKILRLYKIVPSTWLYLGLIWLASISGRVYWLDYANSRNLETVGGIVVLYLGLRLLQTYTIKRLLVFTGVAGIVFFADQLQLYVVGGGLLLFTLLQLVKRWSRRQLKHSGLLVCSLIGGYLVAKLLLLLAVASLPVTFLVAPKGAESVSLHNLGATVYGLLNSTARIFDASFYGAASAPNALREVLNVCILIALAIGVIYVLRKMNTKRSLPIALMCCIFMSYIVYVASGQVLQPITERYLIMVPLLFVLLIGSVGYSDLAITSVAKYVKLGIGVALLLSSVLACGALAISYPSRYSKDAYVTNALSFLQANGFSYAVSSRDAIPETFFAGGAVQVIPTICQPNHRLIESNLFYDKAAFTIPREFAQVPIIVPTGGIISSGSICDVSDIIAQFGQPTTSMTVPGIGTAQLYPKSQINLTE